MKLTDLEMQAIQADLLLMTNESSISDLERYRDYLAKTVINKLYGMLTEIQDLPNFYNNAISGILVQIEETKADIKEVREKIGEMKALRN